MISDQGSVLAFPVYVVREPNPVSLIFAADDKANQFY